MKDFSNYVFWEFIWGEASIFSLNNFNRFNPKERALDLWGLVWPVHEEERKKSMEKDGWKQNSETIKFFI